MVEKTTLSVIIRSIGREGLKRAIDSVTKQSFSNIELVVINDSNSRLDWVNELKGGSISSLVLVDNFENHGRCRAANLGLESASGQYILFLDDDDWIDSGHIEKLLIALKSNADAVLSYTGTLVVDEKGEEIGRFDFELAYEQMQILAGNYMPIHSVLFCSSVLTKGCRFDESLDIYEDWDFWIQLSRHGNFAYTPGISAYYVLSNDQNSGAHLPQKAYEARIKILKKWLAMFGESEILFLMSETTKARDINKLNSDINKLNSDINKLNSDVNSLKDTIFKIINSKSWKITKPLRYVINKLRSIRQITKNKLIFEKGSTFNGNIVYKTNFISNGGDKICIFSHFDKDNKVDNYVVAYLRELKTNQCDIVFVSTAEGLDKNELSKISSLCSQIIIKENIGYDFGSWSHGINECNDILNKYNKLIICNDSVYAPLFKFDTMFDKMNLSNLDAWSITDSHEISYHMQSYFIVFNKKIVNNFLNN